MAVPYAMLAEAGSSLAGVFSNLRGTVGNFSSGVGEAMKPLGQARELFGKLTGVVGQVIGPFKSLVESVLGLPDYFKGIAQQAAAYVQHFDPGAVQAMNQALRSVSATIGYALQDVVRGFTVSTREFAGAIMGAMDMIRPAVAQTVAAFRMVLQPILHLTNRVLLTLADRAGRLMPLVQLFAVALDQTISRFVVFYELLNVLVDSIVEGLGEFLSTFSLLARGRDWKSFGDVVKDVRSAMVLLTKAIITVFDTVLRLTGRAATADRFLKRLAEGPAKSGRPAAPENFQIGGLEDLYRRRLLEAAKASGDDPASRQASAMEDIRGYAEEQLAASWDIKSLVQAIVDYFTSGAFSAAVRQGVREALPSLPSGPAEAAQQLPLFKALDWLKQKAMNEL